MADIRDLLKRLAADEENLRARRFLAPCVRGGGVRASVAGLVYTFTPDPPDFEGWGVFQPADERTARVVEEADAARVAEYLGLFTAFRLRLAYPLRGATWLAYPANESDARQRLSHPRGVGRPVLVHLVTEGREFEQAVARTVGGAWWFEELDRRADPLDAERLREARRNKLAPEALGWPGLTPEMRSCYSLIVRREERERRRKEQTRQSRDERRLREALHFGGGKLHGFTDRGGHWIVEWTAPDGPEVHVSAISKSDLTVLSAGICLNDEDEKFDLQSLVGVIEERWE